MYTYATLATAGVGFTAPLFASPSPPDTDTTNDALLPLCLAIDPRVAANLAISSAETIDRELEKASPDLITEIEGLGDNFRLYRAKHRKLHLDKIESLLKTRRDKK